jgi:hypothetical protein
MLLGRLEQQLWRRTTTAAGGSLRQQPWLRIGVDDEVEMMRALESKKGECVICAQYVRRAHLSAWWR